MDTKGPEVLSSNSAADTSIPLSTETGEQGSNQETSIYDKATSFYSLICRPFSTFSANFKKNPCTTVIVVLPFALIFKLFTIGVFLNGAIESLVLLVLDIWFMTAFIIKMAIWLPSLLISFLLNKAFYLMFSVATWAIVGITFLAVANKLTLFITRRFQRPGDVSLSESSENRTEQGTDTPNLWNDAFIFCIGILRSIRDGVLVLLSSAQEVLSYLDNILNATSGNLVPNQGEASRPKNE